MMNLFQPFGHKTVAQKRWLIVFWTSLLLLAWQFWPAVFFPRPLGTLDSLVWFVNRGLLIEIWVSTWVIVRAGIAIAFPLGCILTYLYPIPFFQPLVVMIASCRNMSMGALFAMFVLMGLPGDSMKVLIMSFILLVYFVSSGTAIVDAIPQDEIDHGIAMRMSPWQTLYHRLVRGRLYDMSIAFIPCISMGWAMLSFIEGIARGLGGLGELMLQSDKINSYNGILAITLIALFFGLIISVGLKALLGFCFPYAVQKSVK